MRLINTSTGQFREFFDTQRPHYAILSHTWGNEEVSYLDFLFLTSSLPANSLGVAQILRNPRRDSEGFRKIERSCELARSRGLDWVWIDSCCIDKSSSAELSEAINSMWAWYMDARECYVYLFDVSVGPERNPADNFLRLGHQGLAQFSQARWFGRGWTLQELLAPKEVLFYNKDWALIATKADIGKEISRITKIPLVFLNGTHSPSNDKICSVAMRMSWVAPRQTTRTEDMAYCMLGLFNVHMPLIYGEGRKAFMRLQLEILKRSDDDSIYAWQDPCSSSGLLATWPTAFANCSEIVQIVFPDDHSPWLPPVMTANGLEMRGRYQRRDANQEQIDAQYGVHTLTTSIPIGELAVLIMHCGPCLDMERPITQEWRQGDAGKALIIYLQRFGSTWQRIRCDQMQFTQYTLSGFGGNDAYKLYYIAQQGM